MRFVVVLACTPGAIAQVITDTTVSFSWDRPPTAMRLPKDLCGFSIESDRFPDWAGNVSYKNEFTYNLMNNLKEKTGLAPHIRRVVGGGSQEYIRSTPNITGDPGFYNVFDAVPDVPKSTKLLFPQAKFTGAGFNYWLSSGNFPAGTKFTWGVSLLPKNTSEAIAQIKQIEAAFADPHCKDVELESIELGNEADSLNDGTRRPYNYSVWDYKDEQLKYSEAISTELGQNGRKFRLGDFSLYWTTMDLLATNIMGSSMGDSISAISEHHYQGVTDLGPRDVAGIAAELVYKDYIRGNISGYTLSALDAQNAGIHFVLGETNTYFGHGHQGVSNSAAAALWMIDYSLQAAVNGITGLHFHQGVGYNYSAFVTVDNIGINITDFDPVAHRHVMPLYYGYLAVADAIGRANSTYVSELWTEKNRLAAYQIWEAQELKRIMFINSVPWSTSGARPIYAVKLHGLAGRSDIKYKTLEFSSLTDLEGLKWGGQSWETSSGLPEGEEVLGTLNSQGVFNINASSAALIYL